MTRLAALFVLAALTLGFGAVADAGSKDGPRRWTKTIKKSSEVVYKIVFTVGNNPTNKFAEFSVIGDGGTDVDIEVYDSKGKLVVSDVELTDLAFVRWAPTATQEYTIKVKNLGSDDNTCHMGHN
jgi:hypothetical protein